MKENQIHSNRSCKILVFTYGIPYPDRSSGERRFVEMLQLLSKKHKVYLYVDGISNEESANVSSKDQNYLTELGIHLISPAPLHLKENADHYDVGFFEFYWIASKYLHQFLFRNPRAAVIIDSVDVHFAREESQARLGLLPQKRAAKTRKRELFYYRQADVVISVSQDDDHLLRTAGPIQDTVLIPNIVPNSPRAKGIRSPHVLFIGSYKWEPNCDAILWFTRQIWPIVIKERPDAKLRIVGNSPTAEIQKLTTDTTVDVVGWVPDTSPYLNSAAVSIAPLRFGGGMKGKVNEALAHGVPVVTTSIGAQGLQARHTSELFIADDENSFANAILTLLNDDRLQESIGLAGQLLNARIASREAAERSLNTALSQAMEFASKRNRVDYFKKLIAVSAPALLNFAFCKGRNLCRRIASFPTTKPAVQRP